jgi:hypothetical protein
MHVKNVTTDCHDVPDLMKTYKLRRILKKKVTFYARCKKCVDCQEFFMVGRLLVMLLRKWNLVVSWVPQTQ